jgi:hypothetical protein
MCVHNSVRLQLKITMFLYLIWMECIRIMHKKIMSVCPSTCSFSKLMNVPAELLSSSFHVGLEILTEVVLGHNTVLSVESQSTFRGTCRLHLRDRRINQVESQHWFPLLSYWFLAWLILRPSKWRRHAPPKHSLTFSGLHGFSSQKIELSSFISCSKGAWFKSCSEVRFLWHIIRTFPQFL